MAGVPEQFSHHVKAETVVVLHLPFPMPHSSNAQVHKAGCQHAHKATSVGQPQSGAEMVEQTTTKYVDDYYYVAPCARKAG